MEGRQRYGGERHARRAKPGTTKSHRHDGGQEKIEAFRRGGRQSMPVT